MPPFSERLNKSRVRRATRPLFPHEDERRPSNTRLHIYTEYTCTYIKRWMHARMIMFKHVRCSGCQAGLGLVVLVLPNIRYLSNVPENPPQPSTRAALFFHTYRHLYTHSPPFYNIHKTLTSSSWHSTVHRDIRKSFGIAHKTCRR